VCAVLCIIALGTPLYFSIYVCHKYCTHVGISKYRTVFLYCLWVWSEDLTYFLLLFVVCDYRIKDSCLPLGRLFVIQCRLRRMFFDWYYLVPLGDIYCICIYMLSHLTSKWTSIINPRIKQTGELETCQVGTRCTNKNRGGSDSKWQPIMRKK